VSRSATGRSAKASRSIIWNASVVRWSARLQPSVPVINSLQDASVVWSARLQPSVLVISWLQDASVVWSARLQPSVPVISWLQDASVVWSARLQPSVPVISSLQDASVVWSARLQPSVVVARPLHPRGKVSTVHGVVFRMRRDECAGESQDISVGTALERVVGGRFRCEERIGVAHHVRDPVAEHLRR
jgi:hypothetical protein